METIELTETDEVVTVSDNIVEKSEKPKKKKRKDILVRAKIDREKQKHGFYDNRRIYDGDEFVIKSMKDFSKNWMVLVDGG